MKTADRITADLERVLWAWTVLLLVGALSVAAGIIVLAKPHISLATLAVVFGIFLLIDGVLEVSWSLVRRGENRALIAVVGVVTAVVGIVLIRHPTKSVVVIALLVGLWLIVLGLIRLVRAFDQPDHRGWAMLSGVVELAGGIVIVSSPHIGVATLALLVGIVFIVRGIALGVVAWALHRAARAPSRPAHGAAPAT